MKNRLQVFRDEQIREVYFSNKKIHVQAFACLSLNCVLFYNSYILYMLILQIGHIHTESVKDKTPSIELTTSYSCLILETVSGTCTIKYTGFVKL